MHLSFRFDDFLRTRSTGSDGASDIKVPTFLMQNGVLGHLKIGEPKENLLSGENTRIEVDLEGAYRSPNTSCRVLTTTRLHAH